MKRDAKVLEQVRLDAEADARLRSDLAREADLEMRSQRVAATSSASAAKIMKNIKEYVAHDVSMASRVDLESPTPNPVGSFLFTPFSGNSNSPPLPHQFTPFTHFFFFFLGASIHSDLFKRDSVEFDLFRVYFPPGIEDFLASMVNEEVASTRTREQLQNQRHFNGVSGLEMMSWVLERLDFTLNVKNTIKLAYKAVLMASYFTIGSLRLFSRTDSFFPRKPSIARVGCPYPVSISSMAILVVMYLRFFVILQRFGRWFGALDP